MPTSSAKSMLAVADEDWLYARNDDDSARYVLGTPGDSPLLCFGINPSTAAPNALDRTVARVAQVAAEHGHDSFVMLNVYPQRATKPWDMHAFAQPLLVEENERHIAQVVRGRPLTAWAAWGTNIETRPYLAQSLVRILALPQLATCSWVSRGGLTKQHHPRHPLYVRNGTPLVPFDMARYRRRLGTSVI